MKIPDSKIPVSHGRASVLWLRKELLHEFSPLQVDFLSTSAKTFVCTSMTSKNANHPEPAPEEMSLDAPVEPLLEELRAFYAAFLPPELAEDSFLATALYLTTHPVMEERLHAMLGRRIEQSATLPIEKPIAKESAGSPGVKRAAQK